MRLRQVPATCMRPAAQQLPLPACGMEHCHKGQLTVKAQQVRQVYGLASYSSSKFMYSNTSCSVACLCTHSQHTTPKQGSTQVTKHHHAFYPVPSKLHCTKYTCFCHKAHLRMQTEPYPTTCKELGGPPQLGCRAPNVASRCDCFLFCTTVAQDSRKAHMRCKGRACMQY